MFFLPCPDGAVASRSECTCPCSFQVVMVFPGPRAVSVQDMIQHLHEQSNSRLHHTSDEPKKKRLKCDELGASACTAESSLTGTAETKGTESRQCPLQRVVFIDSTWNQTNKISTDERLQGNQAFSTRLLFILFSGQMYISCMKSTLSSDMLLSRFTASGAEDEENLFLASSEGKTGLLPGYH